MERDSGNVSISRKEFEDLQNRLELAEETLRAIRSGEVDALVVSGPQGDQVFTLKEAAHPYQVMVEAMNEGAATLTPKGMILYCNSRFAELLGLPMETVLGESLSRFIAPRHKREISRMLKDGVRSSCRSELVLISPAGEREAGVSIRSMKTEGTTQLVVIFTDLEDLRHAEKRIRHLADQYQSLLLTSADGYWLLNDAGTILDVNEAYCRMSGYSRKELLSTPVEQQMKPDGAPAKLLQQLGNVKMKGFERIESQLQKKSGEVMAVELSMNYLKEPGQFIIFLHDITGRKERVQKLEEYHRHLEEMVQVRADQLKKETGERLKLMDELEKSEKRYRELVKFAPSGIYEIDFKTDRFISVNDTMCQTLGYTREELLGIPPINILTRDSQALFFARGQAWKDGKKVDPNAEYQIVKKDGAIVDALLNVSTNVGPDGLPVTATVVATDITERKRIELELEKSEKRYRELIEFAPTGIYEVDFRTGNFISVNDAMCDILGYSRDELISMTAAEVLDQESQERFKERISTWIAGEKPDTNVEYKVLTKSGQEIYAILNVRFTQDANGTPLGAMVIAHDITERKRMEEEIRATAKKLAASNAELKWLNDTMVNRELRMIELKKEINELCQAAGVEPRYP